MSSGPRAPRWLERADAPRNFVATVCSDGDLDTAQSLLEAETAGVSLGKAHRPGANACTLDLDCDAAAAWSLMQRLRERLDGADVYLQPRDELGRKLLICDMDMTIVAAETLDEVAAMLGLGEKIAQITRRAMLGEIDFKAALRERIAMLRGQPEQVFYDVSARLSLNTGARRLLAGAKAAGVRTILVSGGFAQVADEVARQLEFDEVYCNHLEIQDGRLTGEVREPIIDAGRKQRLLQQRATTSGIPLQACCAIGDGANDLPMLEIAGLGIAYRGKPLLRDAIPCHIDHGGLDTALYFMGLRPE